MHLIATQEKSRKGYVGSNPARRSSIAHKVIAFVWQGLLLLAKNKLLKGVSYGKGIVAVVG